MRTAVHITEAETGSATLRFFSAQDMQTAPDERLQCVWEYNGSSYTRTWIAPTIDKHQRALMRYLSEVDEQHAQGSALKLVRAILALGGKLVVWDEKLNKYRNLSTAQGAPKVFRLGSTKLQVEAVDEADALKKAPAILTRAMLDTPGDAPFLAKWYGSPVVSLIDDGAVPAGVPMEDLARNDDELKLSKEPIGKLSFRQAPGGKDEEA